MNSFSKLTTAKYESQALNPLFHCGHHMRVQTPPVETQQKRWKYSHPAVNSQWKTRQKQKCYQVTERLYRGSYALQWIRKGGPDFSHWRERKKKGAKSWKAEAFPQSRNFINLHYLKVTDSTHKTTAGLHTNRTTRAKFWYLQFTLISHGVVCT